MTGDLLRDICEKIGDNVSACGLDRRHARCDIIERRWKDNQRLLVAISNRIGGRNLC